MIDTDKYEGHNAPWKVVEYIDDIRVVGEVNDIDAQLIADAPLLLAEVKRLRKQVQAAHEWVMDYFVHEMGGSDYGDWIDHMTYKGNGGLRDD